MDLYSVLGLRRDADTTAIRHAYRTLARRYHPDSGVGSSPERFRQVSEAYETLIDPGRRRGYDRLTYNQPVLRSRFVQADQVEPMLSPHIQHGAWDELTPPPIRAEMPTGARSASWVLHIRFVG